MELLRSELAEKHYFIKESQLKSFVSFVGTERGIFCPATFKVDFFTVEMSRNTFEQVQLFVLEFDNVECLDAILSRANRYQDAVLFAYLFLNDLGKQGFRVVFLNDVPIEYPEVAEVMMEALLAVFPEASKKSRDFTEVYTGGKKLLYVAPTVSTRKKYE